MLLLLLPVALTFAALAADGAEAPDKSSMFALYSDDLLTRRSTPYIRFGRGLDAAHWTKRYDSRSGRNDYIRFGRSKANYIRFGRAGKHAAPWEYGDYDDGGLLDRDDQAGRSGLDNAGAADDHDRRRRRRRRR